MPNSPTAEAVANNVRAEMARARRTQVEACGVLGISQPSLSRRLAGEVAFSVDELIDLAGWLGVDFSSLIQQGSAA